MPPTFTPYAFVKFRDAVELPYSDDIGDEIERQGIGPWSQLQERYQGIRILRLFRAVTPTDLQRIVERGRELDSTHHSPNPLAYFVVEVSMVADLDSLVHTLRGWPAVELAYVPLEPRPANTPPPQPSLNATQGYLGSAPVGIDATCAWTYPGGDGSGQSIIDLETGWTLNHSDFAQHQPLKLFGELDEVDRSHGTSVLGIVCAVGVAGNSGVVPNVQDVNVVSYKTSPNAPPQTQGIPDAVMMAIMHLALGDVLLLEVQLGNFLPCETDPMCFAAISQATAAGIVVVEAAGNGNQDLDAVVDFNGHPYLSRTAAATFTDSLAIVVAASTTDVPHMRRANSNYGSRIDCYAWGDSVLTSSSSAPSDVNSHTFAPDFANTSAAAAIIAGAALSVQGMRQAAGRPRLGPAQLRAELQTGTASPSPQPIGIMPDLCAIGFQINRARTGASDLPRPAAPTNLRIVD